MIKSCYVFSSEFRHSKEEYGDCFRANCNMVYLKIKNGELSPYNITIPKLLGYVGSDVLVLRVVSKTFVGDFLNFFNVGFVR